MAVKINNQGSHVKISTQGPAGPQGAQGEQGQVGPAGADGADGINGADGADGAQGPAGPAGAQGDQGIQGPAGVAGPAGPAGADGADGADGVDGADGADGSDGADGADGSDAVVNLGSPTDIDGVVFGDGSNLDAATAAEIRAAAELDTTDSPSFAGLEVDSGSGVSGSVISSPTFIAIAPNGSNVSTESLRLGSNSGELLLDALGQELTLSADNVAKLTMDSTGLVVKGDLMSDSNARDIGDSSTGRFGDAYADNLDLSGDISLSNGASVDVGGGTGTLNVDGKIILKHNGGTGIDVENSNGNFYDRVSYIGSGEASKNYQFSGISHNVVALANGYAFRWRVQNTDALKIEYGGHVTVEQDLEAKGDVDFSGLPTSDPAVAGRLWNDSGTLKISAG